MESPSGALAAIPVLPVRDLGRSMAFYARLGFEAAGVHRDYAILRRGAAELHLVVADVDPATNPAGLYLRVEGVDAWAALLGAAAEDRPWGQREVAAEDPDGNLLRLGAPLAGGASA